MTAAFTKFLFPLPSTMGFLGLMPAKELEENGWGGYRNGTRWTLSLSLSPFLLLGLVPATELVQIQGQPLRNRRLSEE